MAIVMSQQLQDKISECQDATCLADMDIDSSSPATRKRTSSEHHLQPSAACSESLPSSDDGEQCHSDKGMSTAVSAEHGCFYNPTHASMRVEHHGGMGNLLEQLCCDAQHIHWSKRRQLSHARALAGCPPVRTQLSSRPQLEGSCPSITPVALSSPPVPFTSYPSAGASALCNLEALVAACELAAEKEGLNHEDAHYYEELVAGSPAMRPGGHHNSSSPDVAAVVPLPAPCAVDHLASWPSSARAQAYEHEMPSAAGGAFGALAVDTEPCGTPVLHEGDTGPKYRRHKSKVFIRPNKVVYLPTTFMEEAFDPACLPINCDMLVEADGVLVAGETHHVTIKAVPRQGLSTMYCMTNVMKFQQQYLNWQILHWTKLDDHHIKIHLQGPNSTGQVAMARTSSVPTPRMATANRTGHAALAHAANHARDMLSAEPPHIGLEDTGLLRSFSSSMGDPLRPHSFSHAMSSRQPPFAHIVLGVDAMPEDVSCQAGQEAARRSTRAVRMTAVMAEHLQQEKQQACGKLNKHQGHRSSDMGAPVSPVDGAMLHGGSNQQHGYWGQDLMPGSNMPLRHPGSSLMSGMPFQMGFHLPASCLAPPGAAGGYMEGSATANLYYMPPSGNSKAAAPCAAYASPFSEPTAHVPGAAPAPVEGAPPAAATAPGTFVPRLASGGPHCVMTPAAGIPFPTSSIRATPAAWEQNLMDSSPHGSSSAGGPASAMGVPHLPASMFAGKLAGSSSGSSSFTLPAPKPLNTQLQAQSGAPGARPVSPHLVGMLGPSLTTTLLAPGLFSGYSTGQGYCAAGMGMSAQQAAVAAAAAAACQQPCSDEDGASGNNLSSSSVDADGMVEGNTSSSTNNELRSGESSAGRDLGMLELDSDGPGSVKGVGSAAATGTAAATSRGPNAANGQYRMQQDPREDGQGATSCFTDASYKRCRVEPRSAPVTKGQTESVNGATTGLFSAASVPPPAAPKTLDLSAGQAHSTAAALVATTSAPAIGVPTAATYPFMLGTHMSAMQALFALSQLQPLAPAAQQQQQTLSHALGSAGPLAGTAMHGLGIAAGPAPGHEGSTAHCQLPPVATLPC